MRKADAADEWIDSTIRRSIEQHGP
jgi:hypothetical protein